MICPTHKCNLVPNKTKYGVRYGCPEQLCTVACWDGSTSTPADYDTRQARIEAHDFFDHLWKSGIFTRSEAYKRLAKFLRVKTKDTHIGQFDKVTALKVRDFAENILAKRKLKNDN